MLCTEFMRIKYALDLFVNKYIYFFARKSRGGGENLFVPNINTKKKLSSKNKHARCTNNLFSRNLSPQPPMRACKCDIKTSAANVYSCCIHIEWYMETFTE